MNKIKQTNSSLASVFGIIGFIIAFIISSLLTDNFILSVLGGMLGYWSGKKLGRWISAQTAALIALGGGVTLLSLRFLGIKVFEVIVEKIIEAFVF